MKKMGIVFGKSLSMRRAFAELLELNKDEITLYDLEFIAVCMRDNLRDDFENSEELYKFLDLVVWCASRDIKNMEQE